MQVEERLYEILDFTLHQLSGVKPDEWAEQRMKITIGSFPGPLSFDRAPFARKILNCLSPYHHANTVVLMGGSQIGKTKSIIEPSIAYRISEHPCRIGYLTGHSDLSDESMAKLDSALDNAGLRPLIKANTLRKRNSRTGDTNKSKEFIGGSLTSGSATNHKMLRQYDWAYIIADDIEAAKGASKESGSTIKMIEQRAASYGKKRKVFYVSTPELKETSIIEPLYLKGNQERYHIPCPCCGEMIILEWSIQIDDKERAGITWKVDEMNRLVKGSVGYICQKCGDFFNERKKREFLLNGLWIPTADPADDTFFSFHLSSLYAMPGMYDWEHYTRDWLDANPPGQPAKEHLLKTFYNLCLGLTYESKAESPQANQIQRNKRNYPIGMVPEKMSLSDGNGRIVLLTCAADMNGTVEDARLDWEILAWAETGATYSIAHGSIGTFIPREKVKSDRTPWTYEANKENSVWPEFEKIITSTLETDTDRRLSIHICGLDSGHYTNHAYAFIDKSSANIVGLKGDKEDKYIRFGIDVPKIKPSKERPTNLYILQVGLIKDDLSENMQLKWEDGDAEAQPIGFMNFPNSENGLYEYKNYFSHFEAEHRVIETDPTGNGVAAKWVKKVSTAQNHMWDCRVYNMALRDILLFQLKKAHGLKELLWVDYVSGYLSVMFPEA